MSSAKRLHLEDAEQRAFVEWAQLVRIPKTGEPVSNYLFAIPNGGNRNVIEAKRLKAAGVKAGVSDLFLSYPSVSVHGLYIEMKKRRKDFSSDAIANLAVTENQKLWIYRMRAAGYMAVVCYGANEAITVVRTYLGIK